MTMLLTITTTHQPATDLGYLLHKHPERCQSFDMSFGQVHVGLTQKARALVDGYAAWSILAVSTWAASNRAGGRYASVE
jgi:hypothetical protein